MATAKTFDPTIPNLGLFVSGARYSAGGNTLRRARGIQQPFIGGISSRWGSTKLYDLTAHSLYRFGDIRFQGVGTQLYRNGSLIDSGYDGNRLSFVKMPPSLDIEVGGTQTGNLNRLISDPGDPSIPDSLFVSSRGRLKKVDNSGNVSNWGIAAPTLDFLASKQSPLSKTIDSFDDASTWTLTASTLADEATIKQEGANSLKMTVATSTVGSAHKAIVLDLNSFSSGEQSALEDFIVIWVRVDNPSNVEHLQLLLDVDDGSFSVNVFSVTIPIVTTNVPAEQLVEQTVGLGSVIHPDDINFISNQDTTDPDAHSVDKTQVGDLLAQLSQNQIPLGQNLWTKLRIPKRLFNQTGPTSATWENVSAAKVIMKTNSRGQAIAYFDHLALEGGAGMLGTYQYHITFRNSVSGSRSNPNPLPVTVENVTRQPVRLNNFPLATDPQVDQIEIWRTVGNGAEFFKVTEIDAATSEYVDVVSDFTGFNAITDEQTLQSTVLPFDNILPEMTYSRCFGPYLGRMWWCGDSVTGTRGRLYYSPVGRPESVLGFINVSNDDDPTQMGVIWNEQAYVFTEAKLYRIVSDTEPFVAREVYGCPGTKYPDTVKGTPYGIAYRGDDGPRMFTGALSQQMDIEPVKPLFRGEANYLTQVFNFDVACYKDNEYIMSDGVATIAHDLYRRTWRDLGIGCSALYAEDDTSLLIASFLSKVLILEDRNVTSGDDAIGIEFNVEFNSVMSTTHDSKSLSSPVIATFNKQYLKMIFLDIILPPGQTLQLYIIIDSPTGGDTIRDIATLVSSTPLHQIIEIPHDCPSKIGGIGFRGTLTNRVTINAVSLDVYNAEAAA